MNYIKFRIPQYNFNGQFVVFNYWGHMNDKGFTAPYQTSKAMNRKPDEAYIGLKDQKGEEIYIGDIVTCSVGTGIVMWNKALLTFEFEDLVDGDAFYIDNIPFDEKFLIIGNIHKNSELLSI